MFLGWWGKKKAQLEVSIILQSCTNMSYGGSSVGILVRRHMINNYKPWILGKMLSFTALSTKSGTWLFLAKKAFCLLGLECLAAFGNWRGNSACVLEAQRNLGCWRIQINVPECWTQFLDDSRNPANISWPTIISIIPRIIKTTMVYIIVLSALTSNTLTMRIYLHSLTENLSSFCEEQGPSIRSSKNTCWEQLCLSITSISSPRGTERPPNVHSSCSPPCPLLMKWNSVFAKFCEVEHKLSPLLAGSQRPTHPAALLKTLWTLGGLCLARPSWAQGWYF